jgi:hypothetical protein
VLTFKGSSSGCYSRAWQTVRVVRADRPRGGAQLGVCHVLCEFLSPFISIHRMVRSWLQGVGQIVPQERLKDRLGEPERGE